MEMEELKSAEVITAGFPCQDISLAGKGAGLSGERSGLWWQVRRTIRMVRPRIAVLENVAELLGRGMGTVLGSLASIGYDAEWNCISSAAVGAPHERERVWILANSDETQREGGSISERIQKEYSNTSYPRRGKDKPGVVRTLNGLPNQMDRLAALGNSIDPGISELIGRAIMETGK